MNHNEQKRTRKERKQEKKPQRKKERKGRKKVQKNMKQKDKRERKPDRKTNRRKDCSLVGCLTSQQQASVSQGRICTDNLTCCHTEIEVANQTFYLSQSQYTDTGPTSPSADPIAQGAWQGSHWSANV